MNGNTSVDTEGADDPAGRFCRLGAPGAQLGGGSGRGILASLRAGSAMPNPPRPLPFGPGSSSGRSGPFPMDLLVRTPARVRQRLKEGQSFLTEILSRGKVLYEKDDVYT